MPWSNGNPPPSPPLVRVDSLVIGQVVRPYVAYAAWSVVSIRPDPSTPGSLIVVLERDGMRRESSSAGFMCWHGDWLEPGVERFGPLPF